MCYVIVKFSQIASKEELADGKVLAVDRDGVEQSAFCRCGETQPTTTETGAAHMSFEVSF